jgi:effector-binding domain-containing protein
MKALKIILWILVILIVIVLIPPLFMPSEIRVEKSIVMHAEPEVIFEQVNCFVNWEPWNPWADVALNVEFEGPACGTGSMMIWEDRGGKSSQTIIESIEFSLIRTELTFMESNTVWSSWTFERTDDGTLVTWGLTGDAQYPIARWINVLFLRSEIEKYYTRGLDSLNEYTKDLIPMPKFTTGEVAMQNVESKNAFAVRVVCTMEEIEEAMSGSFNQLMEEMTNTGVQMTGPPFAIWYRWEGDEFEFDHCMPVSELRQTTGEVRGLKTYAGKVISVIHTGHYDSSGHSWMALENYLHEHNLESNGDPWEVYLTNPQEEPDHLKWMTELYWPVK